MSWIVTFTKSAASVRILGIAFLRHPGATPSSYKLARAFHTDFTVVDIAIRVVLAGWDTNVVLARFS